MSATEVNRNLFEEQSVAATSNNETRRYDQRKSIYSALALMLVHASAATGSPCGLQIVVASTPGGQACLPVVKSFFDQYDPDSGESNCDGALLNIGIAIMGSGAYGISSDLAISALSNKPKCTQLATLLAAYRHKRAPRGRDGMPAVDSTEGELRLYGISAFLPAGTQQSRIRSDELANQTKFNTAVCHALIHMPVMEEPQRLQGSPTRLVRRLLHLPTVPPADR